LADKVINQIMNYFLINRLTIVAAIAILKEILLGWA